MTRWWAGGRSALLAAALLPAACSMKTIVLDHGGTAGGGGANGIDAGLGGGGNGVGDGGTSDANRVHCSGGAQSFSLAVAPEVPSVMFAVDRSPSMGKNNLGTSGTRYTVIRAAISDTVTKYTSLAGFGYVEFPGQSSDSSCSDCCIGGFVPPSLGHGPGAILDKMNSCWNPAAGQYNCLGSSEAPSAQALKKISTSLKNSMGPLYAILLTDGPPSCSLDSTPDVCDQTAQLVSDMALSLPHIVTAVVAIGDVPIDSDDGGPPINNCLSNIAFAGGQPSGMSSPFYYVANTDVLARSQIDSVVSGTICHIDITEPSFDQNPTRLEVDVNGTPIPNDPINGWTLSTRLDGVPRLDFSGTGCTSLISGLNRSSPRVVVKGCPDPRAPAPFPSPGGP